MPDHAWEGRTVLLCERPELLRKLARHLNIECVVVPEPVRVEDRK